MKKTLPILLIICQMAMLSSSLGSCQAGQSAGRKPPTVLSIWTYYNGEQQRQLDKILQKYNQSLAVQTDTVIRQEAFSSVDDLNQALLNSAKKTPGAKLLPDMFVTYAGIGFDVDQATPLVDYKEYLTTQELQHYLDSFIAMGEHDERLLMFPMAKSTEVLMLNDTAFRELVANSEITYHHLTTYQGIVEAAATYYAYTDSLTAQPNDGKSFFGIDSLANFLFCSVKQLDDDLLRRENGRTVLNFKKTVAKKIWQTYYIPTIKGHFAKHGKYSAEDIKTGRTILTLASTTALPYFPTKIYHADQTNPIDFKILDAPHYRQGDDYFVIQGGGIFMTQTNRERQDKAIQFVKWLTATENNAEFTAKSSYLPVIAENFNQTFIDTAAKQYALSAPVAQGLSVAMSQFSKASPYAPPAVAKYEDIRYAFKTEFDKFCRTDLERVQSRLNNGESYQQVLNDYINEAHFELWYQDITAKLNAILERQ